MHFITTLLATAATFAVTSWALPDPSLRLAFLPKPDPNRPKCLQQSDAEQMADIFRSLIQEYSDELALSALTEDFVDYASSVNILMNRGAGAPKDLTAPTFASRAAFMAGQGSQPQIPFKKLQIFHGCDHVAMRWMTTDSAAGQATKQAELPVIGNVIINTVPAEKGAKYRFRIKTIYSEFNSGAWMVNLGLFTPASMQNSTTAAAAKRSIEEGYRGAMI